MLVYHYASIGFGGSPSAPPPEKNIVHGYYMILKKSQWIVTTVVRKLNTKITHKLNFSFRSIVVYKNLSLCSRLVNSSKYIYIYMMNTKIIIIRKTIFSIKTKQKHLH